MIGGGEMATGVSKRHHRECPSRRGGRCGRPCHPTYQAGVFNARTGKKQTKSFPTEAAARGWRSDALSIARKGGLQEPARGPLRAGAPEWPEKARAGEILTRSHQPYKPGVLREWERSLNLHVLPDLGGQKVSAVRRRDVQALVDRLTASGLSGSTVRNAVNALKVIYRRALENDDIA